MLFVGTHESDPGWATMRKALRQRRTLRLETTLIYVAVVAIVFAGTFFLSWQLGHVIRGNA